MLPKNRLLNFRVTKLPVSKVVLTSKQKLCLRIRSIKLKHNLCFHVNTTLEQAAWSPCRIIICTNSFTIRMKKKLESDIGELDTALEHANGANAEAQRTIKKYQASIMLNNYDN